MPLAPFNDLMAEAASGGYAVGYFESWNLESLLAVADAAEAARSPVILGFSGIYLPQVEHGRKERLSVYAALGAETCRRLTVPACLVFNECPYLDWVHEAIKTGFGLVMPADEKLGPAAHREQVRQVVARAHRSSVAVEAEIAPVPGMSGDLSALPDDLRLTEPAAARAFVEETGVDALAVNVGQAHLHGRREVPLRLDRLEELKEAVPVPLVLHGATSIRTADLKEAARGGVRKINVGSVLKRRYFEGLREGCARVGGDYNPYDVVGSGGNSDILAAAGADLQTTVENLMHVFGSAGRCAGPELQ